MAASGFGALKAAMRAGGTCRTEAVAAGSRGKQLEGAERRIELARLCAQRAFEGSQPRLNTFERGISRVVPWPQNADVESRGMVRAMATKADFSADEWSLIVEAPLIAGMRMLVAEHGGHVREIAAIAEAYGTARDQRWSPHGGRRKLIDEIVWESLQLDRTRFGSPEAVNSQALLDGTGTCLHEAIAILQRKADVDDVEDYRSFVLDLARHVAESQKEGGFLGIGGTRVTEREQAALDEIAAALVSDFR